MVLVTGPTGSGKTVSLYTCLNILNQPGVNISTVEDPAEINLPGVNQVNVNDKAGLTFAAALKSLPAPGPGHHHGRRDPRPRDRRHRDQGGADRPHGDVDAAHQRRADDADPAAPTWAWRPFNIAASVLLITAQRLARKLCENCKAPADYPREALLKAGFKPEDLDGNWKPFRAVGCSMCNNGYKGRVGIYQVMPISEEIQRIILASGNATDIAAHGAT